MKINYKLVFENGETYDMEIDSCKPFDVAIDEFFKNHPELNPDDIVNIISNVGNIAFSFN